MSITPEIYDFIVKIVEDKVKDIRVNREEFDRLEEYFGLKNIERW
ncbi:MAG: hypothetical protein QXU02_00510 [Candidatus Bathyarchaeia archaeon]